MIPKSRALAAERYTEGEEYLLSPHVDRSKETHNHYFVCIATAFDNLPEDIAEKVQDSDCLRKWALIKSGHCDQVAYGFKDNATAKEMAVIMKEISRKVDGYAAFTVQDNAVTVYTARSQTLKAMGKDTFQRSKTDVFRVLSELLGVADVSELTKNAGQAA